MNAKLKRQIKLIPLILYGVGTILGAGIYVIISEVASVSGNQFPLSFLLASTIAIFSGLAYAELSSRFPMSGGEAIYVDKAFSHKGLNTLIGYAVATTGIVTASTILRGFHGYLGLFISIPWWLSASIMILFLTAIAVKGIKESIFVISLITLFEISGLILVIVLGSSHIHKLPELFSDWKSVGLDSTILTGAFIAFFSFIGFEDMVNTAEEVVDAPRVLPRAIIWAIIISTFIYFLVTLACVLSLDLKELQSSSSPLVLVITKNSNISPKAMGVVALVSIVNGALVQIIMVSRILYGMAKIGVAPKIFGEISEKTHTPIASTLVTSLIIWILAISIPIDKLAQVTSFIIISIFIIICLSLIKIKREKSPAPFEVPIWVPYLGVLNCLIFLGFNLYRILI